MSRIAERTRTLMLGILLLGLSAFPVVAQSVPWDGFDFSPNWVALIPPKLPPGTHAAHVFAAWGVTFSSGSEPGPVGGIVPVYFFPADPIIFLDVPVVRNEGMESENSKGLIISFDRPLTRVSLAMVAETDATAVAGFFDAGDNILGEVVEELWYGRAELAFEAAEGSGIVRAEVKYLDPTVPEALARIVADFSEPPTFQRCIPQVAHGAVPGGDRTLQTMLTLTRTTPDTYVRLPDMQGPTISLEFRDTDGAPLTVNLDGEVNHEFEYGLGAHFDGFLATRVLRTSRSFSELDQGYACASSRYPFQLAAVYRIVDPVGEPLAEAGIDSSVPGRLFVGVFEKEPAEATDTALALANVSEHEATATITFFMSPQTTLEKEVMLAPGEQGAWFVDELSEELVGRAAEGTIEITSDESVVATILRTIRGVVSASLPLRRQPEGPPE